jgi:cell division transport system permease protein
VARIEYYFRETASGIRRNGTIAFGAVMTAFIALFLFGLALLIRREIALIVEAITGNVEVSVYVDNNANTETINHIGTVLSQLPAVESATFENQQEACDRAKVIFAGNPTILENTNCDTWPTSFRITLRDTSQYAQIPAALGCEPDAENKLVCTEPGVITVNDFRDVLDRLSALTTAVTLGLFGLSVIMLVSAVVLVANTLRMGMFARRKEINIMRLVGATNWRIRVPFLIEGGSESLLGAGLAVLSLFLGKVFIVDQLAGKILWLPLVRNSDVLGVLPWVIAAAIFVAVVAGTVGMRRYLDV